MQTELQAIIPIATREVLDNSQTVPSQGASESEGSQLLVELLETVLDRFRRVATSHALFLRCISKTCTKHNMVVRLYDMTEVWGKIQAVVCIFFPSIY